MQFNCPPRKTPEDLKDWRDLGDEVEWIPLKSHPVLTSAVPDGDASAPRNLLAWNGKSRLFYWDSTERCVHIFYIRSDKRKPSSILGSSPSKVFQTDAHIDFVVNRISINKNSSALLLVGSDRLCVMSLYSRSYTIDLTLVCRTASIGSQIYHNESNAIRILQVSWHPFSDTHLAILSSDSFFRIFDLSSDLLLPEQEYYLQPVEASQSRNATSICPVDFSFGGDHFWDRFSVFVLFSDGAVYILCPIVPFGSVHKWDSVMEIYTVAHTSGMKSANQIAVNNYSLAVSWLEAIFPQINDETLEGEDLPTLQARPFALLNASLCLQGPLRKVHRGGEVEDTAVRGRECEGRAVSFLYNRVSEDYLVLVTAWSGGQLQFDALLDGEVKPAWTNGSLPRVHVDSHDRILALAMICEPVSSDYTTEWLGHPMALLRLGIVDLTLPRKEKGGSEILLFADPLIPGRIFSIHDGGIDSILLHFLPFTNKASGKDDGTGRALYVHPVLTTSCQANNLLFPLCGFVTLSLSNRFGYSWIIGVTSLQDCIVQEMKTWDMLPMHLDMKNTSTFEKRASFDIECLRRYICNRKRKEKYWGRKVKVE